MPEPKDAKPATKECYDFPLIVIHTVGCPRYTGGVCHPLPTPVPPYGEDEAVAVEMNVAITGGFIEQRNIRAIDASGTTGALRGQYDA